MARKYRLSVNDYRHQCERTSYFLLVFFLKVLVFEGGERTYVQD